MIMLHAAPHAKIQSADDLDRLPLDGFFDLSLDEIASTLGVRLGTVKSSLNRALARMKAVMGEVRV